MARCSCLRKAIPLSTPATCCSSLPASMAAVVSHCPRYLLHLYCASSQPHCWECRTDKHFAGGEKRNHAKRLISAPPCSAPTSASYLDAGATRSSSILSSLRCLCPCCSADGESRAVQNHSTRRKARRFVAPPPPFPLRNSGSVSPQMHLYFFLRLFLACVQMLQRLRIAITSS